MQRNLKTIVEGFCSLSRNGRNQIINFKLFELFKLPFLTCSGQKPKNLLQIFTPIIIISAALELLKRSSACFDFSLHFCRFPFKYKNFVLFFFLFLCGHNIFLKIEFERSFLNFFVSRKILGDEKSI